MSPILMTLASHNAKTVAAMSMNARPVEFSLPTFDIAAILASVKVAFTGARVQAA